MATPGVATAATAVAAASARNEDDRHRVDATALPTADRGGGDDGDDDDELEDFASSDEETGEGGQQPTLDTAMTNELVLVCSNLGMLRVENEGEQPVLMRGEDCEDWVHDLQRAIRRDHAKHKLVAKQLGRWKILQKKLLPLLVNHQHDSSLVLSILKVLVMLTMKPAKDSTNIAEQLKYLRAYKHEFLRQGIIPIMMNILLEPLSRRGSARTAQDYLIMEIVLTLIRNLLAIPNQDPRFVTSTTTYLAHLQESLICTLHQENVYEMVLLFTQDIDSPENREWNLLIMEMIDLTLSGTRPKEAPKKPLSRRRGKQQSQPLADINEVFGSKEVIAASDEATMTVLVEVCNSLVSKSYFQLMNSLKTEFRRGSSKLVLTDRLQYFHLVWFLTSYHRMKIQALKSHYKHQVKMYEKKKEQLLAAMDFDSPQPTEPEKPNYEEKAVLGTLDMFSFNFVLQSVENYASIKNYHGMTVSVQLLTEMMAYIAEMAASDDVRFQRIADSLQHKIFYERDFLDRLPVLLKTWSPGSFPRSYVTDVVTLTHLVFKVLDSQGTIKVLSRRKRLLERAKAKKPRGEDGDASEDESTDEEESERQAQLLLEMQRKEADFDVRRYFSSIVSTDTIKMYCHLLASYRDNSPKVNHYIHSFFYRVKHFQISPNEEWTMQPLLFNIHVLMLFSKMLQDASLARDPTFAGFLDFVRGVVRDFFALADKNHLLFVESLLRQTYASRSCLLIQRSYDPLGSMSRSKAEAVALGREKRISMINEARRHKIAMDHEELEGEAEFQFTLEPSDFQASSLVSSTASREASGESATAASEPSSMSGVSSAQPKRRASSKAAVERAKNWTRVEDRHLAKMYTKYRHLPSVYEVISYEDMFQDRDRTPEQIERRVKYLKLHRKTYDSSEDEDEQKDSGGDDSEGRAGSSDGDDAAPAASADEIASAPQRPRRRLRRTAATRDGSSSESEDDLVLGASAAQAETSRQSLLPDGGPVDEDADVEMEAVDETTGEGNAPAATSGDSGESIAAAASVEAPAASSDARLSETAGGSQASGSGGAGASIESDAGGEASGGERASPDQSLKRARDPEQDGGEPSGASPAKKAARPAAGSPTALDASAAAE